jgi:hypothetical protein
MARGSAWLRRTPHFQEHQPACKPGSVGHRRLASAIRDGHSSGIALACDLGQPTRTASLTSLPRTLSLLTNCPRCRPYSVLLPVGFAMPVPLPDPRCALTAPFHPCPASLRRTKRGGSFSVALSLGLPPPDVIRHRMSMEPGLSSPAAFRRLLERPSGRLTPNPWGFMRAASTRLAAERSTKIIYPEHVVLALRRSTGCRRSSRTRGV